MSTKQEKVTEAEKISHKTTGIRRSHEKGSASSKLTDTTVDETNRKKMTSVHSSPRNHSSGRESTSRNKPGSGSGGRDSTHQHGRYEKHRAKDIEHHNSTRVIKSRDGHSQSRDGHNQSRDPHSRPLQARAHTHRQSNKGLTKPHPQDLSPTQNKMEEEENAGNLDSGIGIDESSSPEAPLGYSQVDKEADVTMNLTEEVLITNDNNEMTLLDQDRSIPADKEDITIHSGTEITSSEVSDTHRYVYDRTTLLDLKDSIRSLITPHGFYCTEQDVLRDILKRHNGAELWDYTTGDSELGDDDRPKHPTTLSLIREHGVIGKHTLKVCNTVVVFDTDTKQMAKVSLSPQRRSFGSGCSWRESAVSSKKSSSGSTSTPSTETVSEIPQERDEVFYNQSRGPSLSLAPPTGYTSYHYSSHPPRVIDHVPYRSRQPRGDWQRQSSNWREKEQKEDEKEPEWMSFGPNDRFEVIELKGLEEHEQEREARRTNEPKQEDEKEFQEQDIGVTLDESPSSSPKLTIMTPMDDVDSGLPSSSPNDDQEFILDGFDFSTGVSICRELATDSDEEDNHGKTQDSKLTKAANEHELTDALMTILQVSGSEERPGHPGMNKPLRAMTLDEIEDTQSPSYDHDQTAFNKLLAAMTSPTEQKSFFNQQIPGPIGPPLKTNSHISRSLFTDDLDKHVPMSLSSFQESPLSTPKLSAPPLSQHYSSHRGLDMPSQWTSGSLASQWGGTPSTEYRHQLLNPSPSSLGMHPHHLRQQQQLNTGWVTEMERRRLTELNQMMILQHEKSRQRQQHQQLHMQKANNVSPTLSLLPTSVIRQMHTTKSNNQLISDVSPAQSSSLHLDQDFSSHTGQSGMAGLSGRMSQPESPLAHPSHHHLHYPPPILPPHVRSYPYSHTPVSTLRTNPMGQTDSLTGYPSGQPHPQMLPPQFRMGNVTTMKRMY